MKISDAFHDLLKEYSIRPVARKIHPEDEYIYTSGLQDGVTLLAREILGQLQEEVTDEKESE